MVRLKGLEPTRIAAREPKGNVTSVKDLKGSISFFSIGECAKVSWL